MVAATKTRESKDESTGSFEVVTQWGLVVLAVIASMGALLRILSPAAINVTQGLNQKTLLYLAAAGGLLLFKQVKTFSMGQLKLEMIEKIRDRQDNQEERLADMALILPLLLPQNEVKHIRNLFARATGGYSGSHAVRTELRRLASIGLPKGGPEDCRDEGRYEVRSWRVCGAYRSWTAVGSKDPGDRRDHREKRVTSRWNGEASFMSIASPEPRPLTPPV